jgi:hypothetical protein
VGAAVLVVDATEARFNFSDDFVIVTASDVPLAGAETAAVVDAELEPLFSVDVGFFCCFDDPRGDNGGLVGGLVTGDVVADTDGDWNSGGGSGAVDASARRAAAEEELFGGEGVAVLAPRVRRSCKATFFSRVATMSGVSSNMLP